MHQTQDLRPAPRMSGDVRRILSSVTISALGTWSYNVGIAVYAYAETQSTAWVAIATVGRYVPALAITWLGARWADRLPRRTVAVSADAFCALMMLALTVVAAVHGPIVLAIVLAALSSGVARIQSAAALSAAADLVTESRLARTAVLISTSEAIATAVGPALASIVLLVSSPTALFALNGVTFAVSAVLIAGITALPRRVPAPADSAARAEGRDDATYRTAVRVAWPLLATRAVGAVVYGVDVVLLAVIATEQLKQGTTGYGWLLAAAGAGGILAGWLLRSRGGGRTALPATVGMTLYALPLLAFVAAPALGGSLATEIVRGFGCVLVTATVIGGLQRAVPSVVSARVFGLTHVLVMLGTSAGAVLAPVLLGAWGLHTTLIVAALVPFLVQLAILPGLLLFDRQGAAALAGLDPRVEVLRRLTIFQDASRGTLYEVADSTDELDVDAGHAVVVEGDVADALYVLVSGTVQVTAESPEGPKVLREMNAPTYFGEIGLIHSVPRTATVTATAPCQLWRVPSHTFLNAATQAGLSGALTESVRVRFGAGPGPTRALGVDV
jgi:predicted MFS family arabinose efflux permease